MTEQDRLKLEGMERVALELHAVFSDARERGQRTQALFFLAAVEAYKAGVSLYAGTLEPSAPMDLPASPEDTSARVMAGERDVPSLVSHDANEPPLIPNEPSPEDRPLASKAAGAVVSKAELWARMRRGRG